ncbi:T7SS effector LXG polymorphic toxin [Bacillus cereus]|uniref:T7SS effector LXG polymorphic toxin n=1 Tax=Bacillus TaxID=1386 RepID=UPI002406ABC2|nr:MULTISPECIES: T7SS effector LXG polymorphic toxin [Bacillus cereus group]MDF9507487.1 T7SS effector LXG polymorphic toxin [Bacillus cereus]MDF9594409.1 T7SS effector LXG polymorphic toxin [Bacillus cereus]MDF9607093.1 T7SS effector LXG polymorphic toxin [Bacillus cereus]MDF9657255.1 T7SS effector LXG polymorphic toxin [Bacillus cereus]MEB4815286.1 T7SS effector LXG polymorphic toxin [Bacillus thuringiensis]
MSLNMYLGEVQSQTQSMNAICNATIQSMEQAIQSIDAFAIDTVLQGQTYSSAKAYLVQTFRPLAQGIICLCEELIRQNEAFPNDFQAKVASTDVIEHEIRQQIQEINQSIASIEAIEVLTPMPGVDAIIAVLIAMRKKLEEKLERLYEFNHSSSNNYSTALQLAASITAGLAEVQSGKGFSPVSGTFSTQGLNMDWVSSIQGIIEETARKNDQSIKDIETNNIIEEKSPVRNAWDDAADSIVGTFETAKKMWEAIQRGSGKAIGDEIESAIALSNMDIGTFINVTYALFHLDETAKNMWHAFSNKIKRDMIEGDAESRTELTTYGLTQIATTILGDRALNKVGHITKGAKASSGVSTFANAVKLAKELKPTLEMLQSFKKEASYTFSSVGGTIITKIPQGELLKAFYKFAKSKDGGKGTGETLSKKKSIPDFVKKQWEAGNRFNKENRPRYPYNEVELEAKEINGKKYVVDSYIPGEEIVSRKFTQLAEVKEKTALSYLSEFTKKYSSGSEISSGKFNPNALKGGRLDGELILEIPVQTKPVPQKIIEEANEKGIIIRDINGKVYN